VSATARSTGTPERRPARYSGPVRVGSHRTGVVRAGVGRTATGQQPRTPLRSGPVRPELRLVTGPVPARAQRTSRSRAPFVLLVLALLVGTTLSLLVLNTAIAVDSLKATSLRHENDRRVQEEQLLRQEVINGSTTQRIAAEAKKAGLVPAATPGYLVVQPHGSSLRGVPSRATAPATPSPTPTPSPASPSPSTPAQGQPSPAGGN
jgi:cell division protein FtsL